MLFEGDTLILGLITSSIGLVLLMYGRRQARPPHVLVGFALLAFPYFVGNALLMLAIAALLCALLWGAVRLGW